MADFFDYLVNQPFDDDDSTNSEIEIKNVPTYLDRNRQTTENEFLYIGGAYKLLNRLQDHGLIIGQPGSGKNKLMNPQIAHTIPLCKKGSQRRILVFSYKGDEISWIAPICKKHNVPIKFLAINDLRSIQPEAGVEGYAWDFASDSGGRFDKIMQQVFALYPKVNDRGRIWNDAAALVTSAIAESLYEIKGTDWGLHDLYQHSLAVITGARSLLNQSQLGEAVNQFIFENGADETTAGVIFNQIVTLMKNIRLPAVHQYWTPKSRWLSLQTFLEEDEGVLVIAPDLESTETSLPIMAAMLERFIDFASIRANHQEVDTFIFIDEFPLLGRIPSFSKIPTFLRGKGINLTAICQTINQIKSVWKDEAETIINNCGYIVAFHTTCEDTARWLTQIPGIRRYIEIHSSSSMGGHGFSFSESEQVVERTQLTTYDFKQGLLKSNPQIGLYYYLYCNELAEYTFGHIPPERVDYLYPPEDPRIAPRVPKPSAYLKIPKVSPTDLEELLSNTNGRWDDFFENYVNSAPDEFNSSIRSGMLEVLGVLVDQNLDALFTALYGK